MRNNRKLRRKKTAAWYKAEIRRIDRWIDEIRHRRFYGGVNGRYRDEAKKQPAALG